jgi:hypothetical protein
VPLLLFLLNFESNLKVRTMPFSQPPPPTTQDEWEHQRLRIKKLYVDEDKTLKEVMATMARERSFRAT